MLGRTHSLHVYVLLLVLVGVDVCLHTGICWKGNSKIHVSATSCTCRNIPSYIGVLYIRLRKDYWFQDGVYLVQ